MVFGESKEGLRARRRNLMELYLRKGTGGTLLPDSQADLDKLKGFGHGEVIKAVVTRPRNYQFHKKFMKLIEYAYNCWDQPETENKHGPVRKSLTTFRKDLTILAGFYEQVMRLDGSVRIEAKSISFARMEQHEFDQLYSAVIDVILKHVLTTHTREDVVQGVLQFV